MHCVKRRSIYGNGGQRACIGINYRSFQEDLKERERQMGDLENLKNSNREIPMNFTWILGNILGGFRGIFL